MKIRFICTLVLLVFCVVPAFAQLQAGDPAPDFSARTLQGDMLRLSSLKGQPLLVELGTTWCPGCIELAQQIETIRPFLREQGVSTVTVYLADAADSIRSFLADEKLAAPDQILIDNGEARRAYGVFGIPRLILIDREFKVVFDAMMMDADDIKARITNDLL